LIKSIEAFFARKRINDDNFFLILNYQIYSMKALICVLGVLLLITVAYGGHLRNESKRDFIFIS